MNVVLIRHGQSVWNAEGRLQGQADVELSELGQRQVAELSRHIGPQPRLICSPLQRARQTAEALLAKPGVVHLDERLAEQDLGEWTGRRLVDLDPAEVSAWRRGEFIPQGAETIGSLQRRAVAAIEAHLGKGPLVAICHGGVIRAAVAGWCGIPRTALAPVAPASVTVIDTERRWIRSYGWQVDVSLAVETPVSHVV